MKYEYENFWESSMILLLPIIALNWDEEELMIGWLFWGFTIGWETKE